MFESPAVILESIVLKSDLWSIKPQPWSMKSQPWLWGLGPGTISKAAQVPVTWGWKSQPDPLSSQGDQLASSTGITWELVGNAEHLVSPKPTESESAFVQNPWVTLSSAKPCSRYWYGGPQRAGAPGRD